MGGFAPKATPSPPSVDSDDDDGNDDNASEDDDDRDAGSTDEMSTWYSTLCHLWQKGWVVLLCQSSHN